MKLTDNAVSDKYGCSGFGIEFDAYSRFCHSAEKKSCLHYNLAPECAVINSKNRIIYWLIAFVLLITCLLLLVLMVVKT